LLIKKKIDLVILAGGKGSRIKKFLKNNPKPMLKFNKKYFLNYILRKACSYNFKKIYILTGFRSHVIFKKFHNKIFNFIKIICIKEKKEMGTGGALYSLRKKVGDFILINGDTLFDIDYNELIKSTKNDKIGSIALVRNFKQKSNKLETLSIKKGLVKYENKGNFMNGGVYFFKKKFLNSIENKKISLESDILPKTINQKKINGKIFNNFFIDIGSKETLKIASKEIKKNFSKTAVFLDRDGVINYDYGYVHEINKFKLKKGVLDGLRYLTQKNYYIFIVTNQAGIGKEIFTLKKFNDLHLYLKNFFIKNGIYISDVQFSPFHIKAKKKKYKKKSGFRKPGNLMIKNIIQNWDINLNKSFMIGDKKNDQLAAKKSNLRFYFAEDNFFKQIKKISNNY
tara:strand:- start:125 stop:1315 length:1191 start_codon:yes stop_codon:yes gene_type:complete